MHKYYTPGHMVERKAHSAAADVYSMGGTPHKPTIKSWTTVVVGVGTFLPIHQA